MHRTEHADPAVDPQALWSLWRRANAALTSDVVGQVSAQVDLSDPEIAVLLRLERAGGRARHSALAVDLGWHRSRLSHQVNRMIERGLVAREGSGARVDVVATGEGLRRIRAAEPVHADAVRAHLMDDLSTLERRLLVDLLTRLASRGEQPTEKGPQS